MNACLFRGSRIALTAGSAALPSLNEVRCWQAGAEDWFEVRAGGSVAMAAAADDRWSPPPGVETLSLRALCALLAEPWLGLALRAAHLVHWRRTSRFCGRCGAPTVDSPAHSALRCPDPECGHLTFPKISPAVIVQVTRDGKILLGRSRHHPRGGYSVLAGFVEPGESLEEAVAREIEEEAGIRVRNVHYFGSQPWPFPDSLMVGFRAGGEEGALSTGDNELEDVGWFGADALPPVPPAYSIARALIDDFVCRCGRDPATLTTWTPAR